MTDPLGENSKNPAKKQEKRVLKIKYNNNKQKMLVLYKRWKKYNQFQLTKNKMDLNNRKMTNYKKWGTHERVFS